MDGHVKVSGAWKRINKMYVKVSGTWKEVQNAYVKTGGAWKQFFVNAVLSGGNGGSVIQGDGAAPYNTTVAIRFNTDGTVETGKSVNGAAITWSSAGNWIDPTSAITGTEDVRFTNFNGAGGGDWTIEAAADDTWIGITTTRTWQMNSTVLESISFDCDFEVRDTGLDTGSSSYTFTINNSA
jgi:hypothetical protein